MVTGNRPPTAWKPLADKSHRGAAADGLEWLEPCIAIPPRFRRQPPIHSQGTLAQPVRQGSGGRQTVAVAKDGGGEGWWTGLADGPGTGWGTFG